MKKFIVSSLIGFLILGFGVASHAIDFKMSGFIDVSSHWGVNIAEPPYEVTDELWGGRINTGSTFTTGQLIPEGIDSTRAYMQERSRFRLDAIADKNLQGTLYFEIDSTRWGEPSGDRNRAGYWQADRPSFEVKNAYITFGMPWIPVPITMNVGIQPLAIRPHMLVYNDGPGITAGIKVDPAMIKLLWFKAIENYDYRSDDADIYGAEVSAKVQNMSIGGYALHYNMNTYPFNVPVAEPSYRADMTWLGLYFGGKLGPVNLDADFVFDTGKVEDRTTGLLADVDYSGWVIQANVDYPWEKFNFGFLGHYASGADTEKTSTTGLPGSSTSIGTPADKAKVYVAPPGAETGGDYSLIYFGTGPAGLNRGLTGRGLASGYRMNPGQQGGTWAAQLYASMKVTPEYTVKFKAMYIGDTTKNGNTPANARKNPLNSSTAFNLRDDSDIGWEFNLENYIQIYKNLIWRVGFGYMITGDAMEYYDPTFLRNKELDNPWLVCTRLTYSF